jgi:hypothetical protein
LNNECLKVNKNNKIKSKILWKWSISLKYKDKIINLLIVINILILKITNEMIFLLNNKEINLKNVQTLN